MEVLKAINAVQAALAIQGIGKDQKNAQQGYMFRGIDSIYNTMAPMLAHAGLVILPAYSDRLVVERESANNKALFYVTVRGDFTFRSAKDGSEVKVSTYGEAMDSGDKATNKAMSAALKYALMQTFTIPTEGDNDSENQTHEVAAKKITPASGMFEAQSIDMQNHLLDIARRVSSLHKKGDISGAWDEWSSAVHELDEIQRAAAWSKLASNERSALKRESETRKAAA